MRPKKNYSVRSMGGPYSLYIQQNWMLPNYLCLLKPSKICTKCLQEHTKSYKRNKHKDSRLIQRFKCDALT